MSSFCDCFALCEPAFFSDTRVITASTERTLCYVELLKPFRANLVLETIRKMISLFTVNRRYWFENIHWRLQELPEYIFQGFVFLWKRLGYCSLNFLITVINKFKYERKNDLKTGHYSKNTSSRKWPILQEIKHLWRSFVNREPYAKPARS